MKRREFITLLGGAVAAWPVAARAQHRDRVRHIGVLTGFSENDREAQRRVTAFLGGLRKLGWTDGRNVRIEYRWGAGDASRIRAYAAELVRLGPDVILVNSSSVLRPLQQETRSIPIVFVQVSDPVVSGFVASLAHPDGNMTGINLFNNEITAKRLALLRELVPTAVRVAALVNPTYAAIAETTATEIEAAARAMGLQIQALNASNSREIDAAFASFARERPDALFVGASGDPFFNSRRVQLVHLASHHRLPATYASRAYPDIGGLMSYGASLVDAYRHIGVYTGRILKGAKPADLPVVQRGNRCKKCPWDGAFLWPCATDVKYRRASA